MEFDWKEYKPSIFELFSLGQAPKIYRLAASHLRRLLGGNKLWGMKIGGTWLTTEYVIRTYLDSNPRPGPKQKNNI